MEQSQKSEQEEGRNPKMLPEIFVLGFIVIILLDFFIFKAFSPEMDHMEVGIEKYVKRSRPRSFAKVDVFEVHEKILIESAQFLK